MKRYLLPALTMGLAILLVGGAYQAGQNAGGVATVHVDLVLSSMPEYRTSDSILEREQMTYLTELRDLQTKLQADVAALEQSAVTMTQTQRQARMQGFQARSDSIEARGVELQKRFEDRRDALLGPLEARVTGIIESLRAEGGYHVVLNTRTPGLLAADKGIDITAKVIERVK